MQKLTLTNKAVSLLGLWHKANEEWKLISQQGQVEYKWWIRDKMSAVISPWNLLILYSRYWSRGDWRWCESLLWSFSVWIFQRKVTYVVTTRSMCVKLNVTVKLWCWTITLNGRQRQNVSKNMTQSGNKCCIIWTLPEIQWYYMFSITVLCNANETMM